ncbi:hypothetical protein Tco_1165576 [Tanacetum coccineum]
MVAKRMVEEEALSEQQKKRKVQVQFEAQFYTEEDWDAIKAKLEANAELTKDVLGKDLPEQDFAKRMAEMVNQRKKHFAEERAKAKRNKPMDQSQLRINMSNYLKNQGTTTKAKLKRYGEELQTKTSKKQRFDDKDVPAIGEKVAESAQEDSETDKEELVEAMNPTPLTTKSDSVSAVGVTSRTMFDPPLIEDAIWSLPLQQKMTRLYRQNPNVLGTLNPHLDNGIYNVVDRVMRPLALKQTRRPRSDRGKARHSVSSTSAHHNLGSSSHQGDDDEDDGASRASTPSPTTYLNSLKPLDYQPYEVLTSSEQNDDLLFERQTKLLNQSQEIHKEVRGGFKSFGKALRGVFGKKKK